MRYFMLLLVLVVTLLGQSFQSSLIWAQDDDTHPIITSVNISQLSLNETNQNFRTQTYSADQALIGLLGETEVLVANIETNEELLRIDIENPKGWQMAFSADNQYFAFTAFEKIIEVWDLSTGEQVLVTEFRGENMYFMADNKFAVQGPSFVYFYDLATGEQIEDAQININRTYDSLLSEDGSQIISAQFSRSGTPGFVMWHEVGQAEPTTTVELPDVHNTTTLDMDFANQMVAVGAELPDETHVIYIIDAETTEIIATFAPLLLDDARGIHKVRFNSDGSLLAVQNDNNILFLDTTTGDVVETIELTGVIDTIEFSPDGTEFIIGGGKYTNMSSELQIYRISQ